MGWQGTPGTCRVAICCLKLTERGLNPGLPNTVYEPLWHTASLSIQHGGGAA